MTARRIVGQSWNAGQTCVADYVLVDRSVEPRLVELLRDAVAEMYGADPQGSPDFARIVNDSHFSRLVRLLDAGGYAAVACGGGHDSATLPRPRCSPESTPARR